MVDGARSGRRRRLALGAIASVFVIAVLDQTTPLTMPSVTRRTLPPSIAMLNWSRRWKRPFPRFIRIPAAIHGVPGTSRDRENGGLQPLRGYLHSSALCWSYGAHREGEADMWQQGTSELPVGEMLAEIRRQGFAAVWVDRNGYADNGQHLQTQLRTETGVAPLVSKDGQISVFLLSDGVLNARTEDGQRQCSGS